MDESSDFAREGREWRERARRCRIERSAYEMWLKRVIPLRRMVLGAATLFSAFAAVAIWYQPEFLGDEWSDVAAFCSLASALLIGVYLIRRPEAHQAECERIVQVCTRLEKSIRAARNLPPEEFAKKVQQWDAAFSDALDAARAVPPDAFRERAERELSIAQ